MYISFIHWGFFSRVLPDSTPRFVRLSVGTLFTFLSFYSVLSSPILPKYSSDLLHHCPCQLG